jgi:hypothetical protein
MRGIVALVDDGAEPVAASGSAAHGSA